MRPKNGLTNHFLVLAAPLALVGCGNLKDFAEPRPAGKVKPAAFEIQSAILESPAGLQVTDDRSVAYVAALKDHKIAVLRMTRETEGQGLEVVLWGDYHYSGDELKVYRKFSCDPHAAKEVGRVDDYYFKMRRDGTSVVLEEVSTLPLLQGEAVLSQSSLEKVRSQLNLASISSEQLTCAKLTGPRREELEASFQEIARLFE